jgi:hypothetical protein
MIHSRVCVALVESALCLAATATAQRPDFTGVWTRTPGAEATTPSVAQTGDAAFRRGDPGSGWGSPITITHQPDRLVVQYDVFSSYDMQPPLRLTFAIGGAASNNTMMLGHGASTLRSTVTWTGDTLVITTLYPGPPGADNRPTSAEVRQSLHLEAPAVLVIETTRAGILGAPSTRSRTTYAKR